MNREYERMAQSLNMDSWVLNRKKSKDLLFHYPTNLNPEQRFIVVG